jgi:hypothetical protein
VPGGSFTSYSNQPGPARVSFQRGSLVAGDLTIEQVQRLCGIERTMCKLVLEALETPSAGVRLNRTECRPTRRGP